MGFWGITLENGKRYSQTVDTSFHVSMAALECATSLEQSERKKPVSVMIERDNVEFLLCTLNHTNQMQQPLDLNFLEGEQVVFFVNGAGVVHLTGYLLDASDTMEEFDDSDEEELEEEEEDSDEEETSLKRKGNFIPVNSAKKMKKNTKSPAVELVEDDVSTEDEDDDDDEDDEELFVTPQPSSPKKRKMNNATSGKVAPKEDMELTPFPKGKIGKQENKAFTPAAGQKQPNKQNKTPQAASNGLNTSVEGSKKKKKKNKNKSLLETTVDSETPQTPKTPKDQVKLAKKTPMKLAGGTSIVDLSIGSGPVAKQGKFVQINYTGKLTNNKTFDSSDGKPLKFRLGQGEVVTGMDLGVAGMKVGGKRKIIIPPNQGYGGKRTGPIPPNSTLIFEVELKAVS